MRSEKKLSLSQEITASCAVAHLQWETRKSFLSRRTCGFSHFKRSKRRAHVGILQTRKPWKCGKWKSLSHLEECTCKMCFWGQRRKGFAVSKDYCTNQSKLSLPFIHFHALKNITAFFWMWVACFHKTGEIHSSSVRTAHPHFLETNQVTKQKRKLSALQKK